MRALSKGSAFLLLSLLSLLLAACGGEAAADLTPSELDASILDPGKADSAAELRVRAGSTTLWADQSLVRQAVDGVDSLVLRGRTSRDLLGGFAFVCDDAFGLFRKVSTRSFTVSWPVTDLGMVLEGVNQFFRLDLKPSAGRPSALTGRAVIRPVLQRLAGDALTLEAEVRPVLYAGQTIYRLRGAAGGTIYGLRLRVGDATVAEGRVLEDSGFEVDLPLANVAGLVGARTDLLFDVDLLAGRFQVRARLHAQIAQLGLTAEEPYATWPVPSCGPEVLACLGALPAGSLDLGACGDALAVRACANQAGVIMDASRQEPVRLALAARLDDPAGFQADALPLVGEARRADFLAEVRAEAEARFTNLLGMWFPSAESAEAALGAELEETFDLAYARPLDFVAAVAPLPGDAQRARDVAADGLLLYLAGRDLTQTEFNRDLVELVRQFRDRHLASLRYFRLEAVPNDWSPNPAWDNYVGNWLDPLVEIRVDRASGALAEILFEID
jgi:hypothetical protein